MVSFIPTKSHKTLISRFKGEVLTSCFIHIYFEKIVSSKGHNFKKKSDNMVNFIPERFQKILIVGSEKLHLQEYD